MSSASTDWQRSSSPARLHLHARQQGATWPSMHFLEEPTPTLSLHMPGLNMAPNFFHSSITRIGKGLCILYRDNTNHKPTLCLFTIPKFTTDMQSCAYAIQDGIKAACLAHPCRKHTCRVRQGCSECLAVSSGNTTSSFSRLCCYLLLKPCCHHEGYMMCLKLQALF